MVALNGLFGLSTSPFQHLANRHGFTATKKALYYFANLTTMKKTIFLTQNPNGFSTNVSKWMYLLFGIFNSVSGIERLTDASLTNWTLFLGILLLSSGLVMFVMGLILFSPTNKFTPRVVIDENEITIRPDLFTSTKLIRWSDIKLIIYKSYVLDFIFNDKENQRVLLPTTAATVVEIKRSLRALADRKLVTVIGG
jgi:hypothetical protein